ncbi:AmpG family muropeptide MFS transporter [Cellvibrio japonicus]|uniref:AmpG protein n=1 Tax=Cellvibrio japonicus (strain Ueda107) TaxID=498211 RepID=B3PLN1_CELJU|nr:MFS transporter [Cellvibrio japonicus]ACE82741.1 AmpG protein [Cellvibrio japonicus Ueda107]
MPPRVVFSPLHCLRRLSMLHNPGSASHSWRHTFMAFRDKRLLCIFLLGCASGFPWVLVGSAMSGWLSDAGLSRAAIGYFGSVTVVYAINFLWAPLLDRIKLPWLGQRLGQRRSWILVMQGLMLFATLGIACTDPAQAIIWTSLLALCVTSCSATQDVAVDAYRIDSIGSDTRRLSAAAAMGVIGWWTGYSLPGFLAFHYADALGWNQVYLLLAGVMGLMMVFTLLVPEPLTEREQLQAQAEAIYMRRLGLSQTLWQRFLVRFSVTVIEPFAEFVRRNGLQLALMILAFVFLFKLGEAFLGRMSIQFYREVGYSNEQIADYSKLVGWLATCVFTLIGSVINVRFGLVRGLLIGGSAMAASNLMFAWIAVAGPSEPLFLAAILVDNFTTAFSSVAFVAFLSWLTGRAFSAAQYALLSSLGNLGRTTLSSFSGELVDLLGGNWVMFFVITSLMVIPSLILLLVISRVFRRRPAPASQSGAN